MKKMIAGVVLAVFILAPCSSLLKAQGGVPPPPPPPRGPIHVI